MQNLCHLRTGNFPEHKENEKSLSLRIYADGLGNSRLHVVQCSVYYLGGESTTKQNIMDEMASFLLLWECVFGWYT